LKQLREFVVRFKKQNVSYDEFIKYLDEVYKPSKLLVPSFVEKAEQLLIPVSVFNNSYLSALEAIVKYLHENKELRLSEIAKLINRDQRAVGVTYRFASRKMKMVLKAPVSKYKLPVSVVAERKLSVLESIVYYLKITHNLSYHDIAIIVRRDDRTVWTVYQRALKKMKGITR
jgi:hypothetical protein